MAVPHYRFRLLGNFGVWDRTNVRIQLRKKEREVLTCALISLVFAEEVSRDVIHEMVWPGVTPGRQLDNQLYQLRLKLPLDIPVSDKSGFIRLSIQRDQVDAWVFADLCRAAKTDGTSWERPVDVWPAGTEDTLRLVDHPVARELEDMLREALRRRLDEAVASGGPTEETVRLLNRLVKVAPEESATWLMLIEHTARSKGPHAAHAVTRRADAAMADLGVPSGDLLVAAQDLIARLRDSPSSDRVPNQRRKSGVVGEVSRSSEVDAILRKVRQFTVTAIEGAPGNGKSWLASRVAEHCGMPFVRISFQSGLAETPANLLLALARHFQGRGDNALANLLEQEVKRGAQYDDLWKATLVADLLGELPTLLIFDDFHLVDYRTQSAHFVRSLFQQVDDAGSSSRTLVVARAMPVGIFDNSASQTVFGVTKYEAGKMVAEMGVALHQGQLDLLYQWTTGNLKLIRMFAGWAIENNATSADVDRLLANPSRWQDARRYLLSNFLNDVPPATYRLVTSLALLRTAVPLAALWAAAEAAGLQPFDSIDGLMRRHVIEQAELWGDGFYLHGILRDFLRDSLQDVDLSSRHGIAAAAQQSTGAIVEELYHLGASGEVQKAIDRLMDCEEEAIQAGHAADLLSLVEEWPVDLETGRSDASLLYGDLLRMSGRLEQAERVFARVATSPQSLYRAVGGISQATTLKNLSRWPRAREVIGKATEEVAATDPPNELLLGLCQTVAGSILAQVGDFSSARDTLTRGIELIRVAQGASAGLAAAPGTKRILRPEVAVGAALCDLGWLELMAGRLVHAESWLNEAAALQARIGDQWGRCETLAWLGRCYWQSVRWDEAEETQRSCLDIARSLGNVRQEALAYRHLGLLAWNSGREEDALRMTSTALEIYRRMGDRYGEAACLENLGAVYFDQDRFADAEVLVRSAEELCASIESIDFLAYAVLYRAKILVRTGDVEEGRLMAMRAHDLLARRDYSFFYTGMALRAEAEAEFRLGRPAECIELLDHARRGFDEMPSRYQSVKCDFLAALAHHATGRIEDAARMMNDARDAFAAMGAVRDLRRAVRVLEEWK